LFILRNLVEFTMSINSFFRGHKINYKIMNSCTTSYVS
jgi:hypothetical protein